MQELEQFEETADHLLFDSVKQNEVRQSTLRTMAKGRHLHQEELIHRMLQLISLLNLDAL